MQHGSKNVQNQTNNAQIHVRIKVNGSNTHTQQADNNSSN